MSPLAQWLAEGADRHPSAPALLGARADWRYDQLLSLAERGGVFLRARAVQPGDAVALAGAAGDLTLAALACSAANAVLLPLDPLTGDDAWPALQALAGGRLKRLPPLPDELNVVATRSVPAGKRDDLALLIATSGSEGAPKVAMLTHANLDAAAVASNLCLPLSVGDVWLACLPLHHVGGMAILCRCLRAGAATLLHEGFSAAAVWRDLHARQVSHLSLVPAMLARLLAVADGVRPPASLRYALIGGAALSKPLCDRALASGWPICPTWGMSETTAQAATLVRAGVEWQPGQVGSLLPGLQARVAADGRLQLRGGQVMAGYLNPAWRRGCGLDDGWLSTGDLGVLEAAGQVRIVGRADDMLISGGVKVHPLEVEACLGACPGVRDVAVTATPDPVWGDALVALVVGSAEIASLHDWCQQHLAAAKRPRRVLRVDALPRNALGKLSRQSLRLLAQQRQPA
ncbi:MAG: AMP-binding protein [Candidatus Accumulibacter sp.]|uniref:class I adenylate-forming enzyme family protein n=1 Tax=Accumulibacter sp. TaxID=2053492 RepID=UPI001A07E425|nr:long-chain fatty acid--CoA ligase [Accumulibacter sp.]MBE2260091.1 AMP-binding protein [Paracoccaceae bacterium]MCP5247987.1 AMP-binding protein [Accumulibacter sp.]